MIDNWKKIESNKIDELLDEEEYYVLVKRYSYEENGFVVHVKF
jgi:hypothetical protein